MTKVENKVKNLETMIKYLVSDDSLNLDELLEDNKYKTILRDHKLVLKGLEVHSSRDSCNIDNDTIASGDNLDNGDFDDTDIRKSFDANGDLEKHFEYDSIDSTPNQSPKLSYQTKDESSYGSSSNNNLNSLSHSPTYSIFSNDSHSNLNLINSNESDEIFGEYLNLNYKKIKLEDDYLDIKL